jgi:hypothetical protein
MNEEDKKMGGAREKEENGENRENDAIKVSHSTCPISHRY